MLPHAVSTSRAVVADNLQCDERTHDETDPEDQSHVVMGQPLGVHARLDLGERAREVLTGLDDLAL